MISRRRYLQRLVNTSLSRDVKSIRLVYRGEKQGWELPGTGAVVNFQRVVDALHAHWSVIADQFPRVDDIRVIGIDLSRCSAS